ncbi:MAG: glutamate decarboxylase [Bacteroidetes bacterium HGW-Bacteroidetes-3]|jgi:glutamate/tyrosine decarboxylase-like PLP-dependent enzyme|nr:MAG: glutamate decarboxylase [Bacteroidetes bacterium HGW-Bacteroidetes-3]
MNELNILSESFEKIKSYLESNNDKTQPIVKFKNPSELKEVIDFEIGKKGVSENEFLELIDKYLEYSVKTGNKQFFNQLYSGFNFPAFIGEIFTVLANTSMYTYEVAPVATSIETEMIRLMNRYSGYEDGDGIFVSGGSNANLVAMFSARNKILPESRFDGYDRNLKLKAFVNEQAHYSFETAANILGIGAKNVIKVKSDKKGMMIPSELEKEIKASIERNEKPFFVAATCATTLLGAYDPIDEMAEICQKYDIWLHADGSFGGSLILSDQHRHLMRGIEKTDSFAWNPHKLMNIPLICSALLVKKRGTLQHNITDINADYIFHDIDQIEDLGKKSIQCGRRVDAVKLWFAWKYFGLEGYQKRTDNLIAVATYAEEIVKNHKNLELLADRQSFAVCFRYIPENKTDLNKFNLALREAMRKNEKSIVNYGYIGKTLAIRLITANGELQKSDIDLFFDNLLKTATALENKSSSVLC